MKILVVEDNPVKIDKLRTCLLGVGLVSDEDICFSLCIQHAKQYLKEVVFDLLVLDVILPN